MMDILTEEELRNQEVTLVPSTHQHLLSYLFHEEIYFLTRLSEEAAEETSLHT